MFKDNPNHPPPVELMPANIPQADVEGLLQWLDRVSGQERARKHDAMADKLSQAAAVIRALREAAERVLAGYDGELSLARDRQEIDARFKALRAALRGDGNV